MEKETEFGPAPPSYNQATAPELQQQYPQKDLQPLLQSGYPQQEQQPPYPPQQQPFHPPPQQPLSTYLPQQQHPYPIQQQPLYAPQPPQQNQQSVVINIPQNQAAIPVQCGKTATSTVCSNCRNQIITRVSIATRGQGKNNTICCLLFVLGFCTFFISWFCSCCPYLCSSSGPVTRIYTHSCPQCNAMVGSYTE